MPHTKKPSFEHFRSSLVGNGKPLAEKFIVPIQASIVSRLDDIKDVLVQKVRRQGHKETLVEFSATWVGMDTEVSSIVSALKRGWPEDVFENGESMFYVDRFEENVLLQFAVKYPEDRYLTGRLLVTR
ncbi:MAG: hypothetical protein P4L46_14805 [Fimbriimonas sp.]|nr:hypothetical protein [Fimbriimonas sp.]